MWGFRRKRMIHTETRGDLLDHYLTKRVPVLLEDILGETLTIERLMESQYRCIDDLINPENARYSTFKRLRRSLSQYEHASVFLSALGISPAEYCKQSGLSDEETRKLLQENMKVHDIVGHLCLMKSGHANKAKMH